MTSEVFNFNKNQFEQYIPCHGYFMRRKAISIKKIFPGGSRCLDIGCGSGAMEILIHDHFSEIIGLDSAREQIEQAKRLELKNCTFDLGSSTSLPYNESSFDAVLIVNMMHHINPGEHIKTLNEAFRVMKEGGTLLIYEHNPFHPLVYMRFYYCSKIDRGAHMINPFLMKKNLMDSGIVDVKVRWMVSEAFGEYLVSGIKRSRQKVNFNKL